MAKAKHVERPICMAKRSVSGHINSKVTTTIHFDMKTFNESRVAVVSYCIYAMTPSNLQYILANTSNWTVTISIIA